MYGISPSLKRFRRFTTTLKTSFLQVVLNARTSDLFNQFSLLTVNKTFRVFNVILFIFLFSSQSSLVFAQDCSADIAVIKNRSVRSISESSDTVFQFLLSNDSSIAQSYSLEVIPMDMPCPVENETRASSNRNNDKINFEFYRNGGRGDQLSVPAFGQIRIELKASANRGLITNDWSCFRVIARNQDCDQTNSSEEIISVYARSSNEG